MKTFGEAIGALIKHKRILGGFTQLELALEAYEKTSKVRRIVELENGQVARPQLKKLHRVFETLNITQQDIDECFNYPILNSSDREKLGLSEKLVEALARNFELINPEYDFQQLTKHLIEKSFEWKQLVQRLRSIETPKEEVRKLVKQAEKALLSGEFEIARDILAEAEETHQTEQTLVAIRAQGEMRFMRALTHLFEGKLREAFNDFLLVGNYFAPFSMQEAWDKREDGYVALYSHSRRYTIEGIEIAIELAQVNLRAQSEVDNPKAWAQTQNDLGGMYISLSKFNELKRREELIHDAIDSYSKALRVRNNIKNEFGVSQTQNNLGIALLEKSSFEESNKKMDTLRQSVDVFKDALKYRKSHPHKEHSAKTQNNLGNAYLELANCESGREKAICLNSAVHAISSALEVYNKIDHAEDWALAQANLGRSLSAQLEYCDDSLQESKMLVAAKAFTDSLSIYTEADYPLDFARVQNYIGAFYSNAANFFPIEIKRLMLDQSIVAFRSTLNVYSPETRPLDWANSQNNIGASLLRYAVLFNETEAAKILVECVTAFQNAERVYRSMPVKSTWRRISMQLSLAFITMAILPSFKEPKKPLTRALAILRSITASGHDPDLVGEDVALTSKIENFIVLLEAGDPAWRQAN